MSVGLTITVRGTDQVLAKLAKKPEQLRRAVGVGLRDGALIVLRRAEENLTGKVLRVDTGRLRQSLQVFARPNDGIAGVGTNLVYAKIHEFGGKTLPHRIEARNKKALSFVTGGGMFVSDMTRFTFKRAWFTKGGKFKTKFLRSAQGRSLVTTVRSVQHPGANVPPRPYLRPALRESVPEIQEAIERQIGLILQKGEPT